MKIAFLTSGGGGTLRFLHAALRQTELDADITAVFADRPCQALASAERLGVASTLDHYSRNEPEALRKWLHAVDPDIVITNFHKILDPGTLKSCRARFINLHYSLLPAFAGVIGMRALQQASDQKVRFVGTTCHLVDDTLDGGPILSQSVFAARWDAEEFQTIEDRLFRSGCICLLSALAGEQSSLPSRYELKGLQVQFFPGLPLPLSGFDDAFWQKVRSP